MMTLGGELYLGSVQTNKERRQSSSGWRLHLCFDGEDSNNYFDDDDYVDGEGADEDVEENTPVCCGNNHPAPGKKATVGGVHWLGESLQGQVEDERDNWNLKRKEYQAQIKATSRKVTKQIKIQETSRKAAVGPLSGLTSTSTAPTWIHKMHNEKIGGYNNKEM